MKSKEHQSCEHILREHGYRVTEGRVTLLMFMKSSKHPLSVNAIQEGIPSKIDKVTLYRALEDFSKSKIIAKVNFHNTATYYEFIHKDHHHHHIVCENCGKIEDIETCNGENLQKELLKSSKNFDLITSHSLEFFGVCKKCSAK